MVSTIFITDVVAPSLLNWSKVSTLLHTSLDYKGSLVIVKYTYFVICANRLFFIYAALPFMPIYYCYRLFTLATSDPRDTVV